ncbi:secondary thiamine-phosphate synthase enzyme YjbQ [Kiloniella majae]|uniref:secondary thiamine-phosphate synthase enzyme YjbQ n=1 Tax=Kiloniella majae TaxID=1938558 RepID=UPI000A278053|nr:secondary thiamine-phosphate synthase enzyme YjbQ [Kiloniella majae]
MKQVQTIFDIHTKGQGLYEFTREVSLWAEQQNIVCGLLSLFIRHTSASLTIQENADPDVQFDLNNFFRRVVEENPSLYRHTCEGPDDMPAHIRSALTDVQLSIPIVHGSLALGTWQGIYLFEHRAMPHDRQVIAHLIGE